MSARDTDVLWNLAPSPNFDPCNADSSCNVPENYPKPIALFPEIPHPLANSGSHRSDRIAIQLPTFRRCNQNAKTKNLSRMNWRLFGALIRHLIICQYRVCLFSTVAEIRATYFLYNRHFRSTLLSSWSFSLKHLSFGAVARLSENI